MNGFYDIVLVCMLIGACGQFINESQAFGQTNVKYVELNEDMVTEYQSSTTPTVTDEFTTTNLLFSGLRILGAAMVSIVTIIPFVATACMSLGASLEVAAGIALLLQIPLWFVTIAGWFEWTTGRSLT
jgi:hypothetical protein